MRDLRQEFLRLIWSSNCLLVLNLKKTRLNIFLQTKVVLIISSVGGVINQKCTGDWHCLTTVWGSFHFIATNSSASCVICGNASYIISMLLIIYWILDSLDIFCQNQKKLYWFNVQICTKCLGNSIIKLWPIDPSNVCP